MWRLYGFYTPEVGNIHIGVLQFVTPIVKVHFIKDVPHK